MNWNAVTIAVASCLIAWRCVWLAAGVPDTTFIADKVRTDIERQLGLDADFFARPVTDQNAPSERWRVSFANVENDARKDQTIQLTGIDVWDDSLPIWITPGRDGHPGWAGWDDNGDDVVDDAGELGAAWSDDDCVVQMPGEQPPSGRVIDHGGFRSIRENDDLQNARHRFELVYIRDAP